MKRLRAVFTRDGFCEVEKTRAYSLPPVGWFDKQFVDPGTLAPILQTEIKADDQVGNGIVLLADQTNEAITRIVQKFGEIVSNAEFVEGLGPWIVSLHVAH